MWLRGWSRGADLHLGECGRGLELKGCRRRVKRPNVGEFESKGNLERSE